MDEFKTWFFIGFEHIMDIQALDHTLFILALVVAYDSSQLKKIIFLVFFKINKFIFMFFYPKHNFFII